MVVTFQIHIARNLQKKARYEQERPLWLMSEVSAAVLVSMLVTISCFHYFDLFSLLVNYNFHQGIM